MNIEAHQSADASAPLQERLAAAIAWGAPAIPEAFARALLTGAAPEDVASLEPEALAAMTRDAFTHFKSRVSGRHDLAIYNPNWPGATDVTVIEAVNDDMAFLFDSIAGELVDRGIELKLVSHPILAVARDSEGALTALDANLHDAGARALRRESLIHLHVQRLDSATDRADLKVALDRTLDDVRAANADFAAMRAAVHRVAASYRHEALPYSDEARAEAADFIQWLADDNFILIGLRLSQLKEDGGLEVQRETGLGILKDPKLHALRPGAEGVGDSPEARKLIADHLPLRVTKSSLRSRVHRRAHLDYIGVKLHDAWGAPTGEMRILGLFASNAYTHSVRHIPYLRRKAAIVLDRAGLRPDSHSGKALATVLETYPRDDLFQIETERLLTFALDILSLYDRPRVRVLPRPDPFDRFVSVLVFVPRERFDSDLRARIGARLATAYGGRVAAFTPTFMSEVPLTRIHYIIGRRDGPTPQVDQAALEAEVAADTLSWTDRLREAIRLAHEADAPRLQARYGAAFGPGYVASTAVDTALTDIDLLERLSPDRPIALDFMRRPGDPDTRIALRLLALGAPLPLSVRVPMLENMGLKSINERSYRILPASGDLSEPVAGWLHEMSLERTDGGVIDVTAAAGRMELLLTAVLRDEAENDGFNALVLDTGLDWREVALVRALARYLRQAGIAYSQDYLWSTLVTHKQVAAHIVALFQARFDPALDPAPAARAAREAPLRAAIEAALAQVSSLDEDRILRRFVNLVDAALRTSFYQRDAQGRPRGVIAIKYASRQVEGLALPCPLYEVFVYAARVEGVHLRFGPVARGGLRWSDRPQDFRTEVLGLVKAQQVKNAVIVPVGAKGGFVPKRLPSGGSREAIQAEGIAAYELFVSSLLDLTDNLAADGGILHPPAVVRLDGDDPYLVVAADKGTATFSDIANSLSRQHGFWLDDAFASGGSVGYDHKAMGITARGAWEAVKRHFREINVDIQVTPVTVAGVGDMSGDVFGNGMLLSPALKLVAAFDHRHIFLDPDPDPLRAHAERERLFNLPRSSWADYDAALISEGGGVYARTAKSIALSERARAVLGLDAPHASPAEVMSAILKAPVDLMWFGGIGTYVRASGESDAQVGDRANDAIRIAAADLRAKVVGEGANLGMTQRARIEAARKGVRLNTDAIDNSAGVNTSDVEVNIKIALAAPLAQGQLTPPDRAALLGQMTDDVAELVLRNNYLQTLALSLAERTGGADLPFQQRLMQMLELRGELDRAVEFLPSGAELQERRARGEGLTRPELAVLLAYAKLSLHAEVLASDLPDDPFFAADLLAYFPAALARRFPDAIAGHRLRRDIIATSLSNAVVNQAGPAVIARVADQTGADAASIVRAFVVVSASYDLPRLHAALDALDNRIDGGVQLRLYADVQVLLIGRMVWFLRNVGSGPALADVVERYRAGIEAVSGVLDTSLPQTWLAGRDRAAADLVSKDVPEVLAREIASLPALAAGSDIALLSQATGRSIADAASTFFAAGRFFAVDTVITAAGGIAAPDYYDRLALDRALGQIESFVRQVTADVLATGGSGEAALETWVDRRRKEVERTRATVQDIAASGLTLSKLTLAANLLADLTRM